jgi:hypothetical protein
MGVTVDKLDFAGIFFGRTAATFGRMRRNLRMRSAANRLASASGLLSVDFDGRGIGFFAHMNALLRIGRCAVEKNLIPDVKFISPQYQDLARGPDWLSYYFDGRTEPWRVATRRPIYIRDLAEFPINFDQDLTLAEAHSLLFRFYKLKPDIKNAVAAFCAANAVGEKTLGIHYRGTDKGTEAPRVPAERVLESALSYLASHDAIDSIFLASDEASFVDLAASAFSGFKISFLPDSVRSRDGSPVHLGLECDRYQLGRDALLNSLVLSHCGALMRTSSFLSAWSSIFRPSIDVLLLNKPFAGCLWYPEREIMKTAAILVTQSA